MERKKYQLKNLIQRILLPKYVNKSFENNNYYTYKLQNKIDEGQSFIIYYYKSFKGTWFLTCH